MQTGSRIRTRQVIVDCGSSFAAQAIDVVRWLVQELSFALQYLCLLGGALYSRHIQYCTLMRLISVLPPAVAISVGGRSCGLTGLFHLLAAGARP